MSQAVMSLEDFAAEALDWPAVRDLLRRHAPSSLGREALDCLAPLSDADAAAALGRLREVGLALDRGAGPPLQGCPNPLAALADAGRYSRSLAGEDLDAVARFLRVAHETATWLASRSESMPICAEALKNRPDTTALRADLERSISDKGEVRDDASPALRKLRAGISKLSREVERRVRAIANRADLRAAFAEGSAGQVHRRGGRSVLAVRAKSRGRVAGIVHDTSQTGETVFVEPADVVESGNRLATQRADEKREVGRILIELTRAVLGRGGDLEALGARLAELELAVLGASYAREHGARAARLPGEEGADAGLVLRGFRHPLLVQAEAEGRLEHVVPIDLRLGEEFDMLVLTGPNTGGKTLALKSAGLCVLLTRMGLPVPCEEGTTVPLWDGIAADIGDEQEVQQSLSTFSSHLVRIRAGLQRATPATLVLLDELGGGTDPAEGAALGEAILEELLGRGVPTLVSTHLGQLKEFAFRNARVENGSVEFDLETLAPLYRVMVGLPGESRALAIARRLGLSEKLVDAAQRRIEHRGGEAQELLSDLRDARVDAERMRSSAGDRLVELEQRLEALQAERDELAGRKEQLEAEAQRGVEERVSAARPLLARARAILEQLSRAHGDELGQVVDGLEEALGGATLTERRQAFLRSLKKGDLVWLPRYRKRCRVIRVRKDRGEVAVALGNQELTVDFEDVTFYESL